MRRSAFFLVALTFILSCDADEDSMRPLAVDDGPANPDSLVVLTVPQSEYLAPAVVPVDILNRSDETCLLWDQCHPSAEMWTGHGWSSLEAICVGEAPSELPPGGHAGAHANFAAPGFYRFVYQVTRPVSRRALWYRSAVFQVE